MIVGAIRSSSWAQTDAEQETVSVPPRSAVGVASPAMRRPDRLGPGPLGCCQQRLGGQVVADPIERDRHLARAAAVQGQTTASSRTCPSATANRVTPMSAAPGTCSISVVVITDCP